MSRCGVLPRCLQFLFVIFTAVLLLKAVKRMGSRRCECVFFKSSIVELPVGVSYFVCLSRTLRLF